MFIKPLSQLYLEICNFFSGKDSGLSVVAVKTLKENANLKEKSDLVSELQVMKILDPHPNVVRLLGCCTDKEPIFLIMEFINKGKLQSYLRNSRAERYYNNMHSKSKYLTSRDLTSFVYQVAKGMEFLSNNGVSTNLLVSFFFDNKNMKKLTAQSHVSHHFFYRFFITVASPTELSHYSNFKSVPSSLVVERNYTVLEVIKCS